MACSLTTTQTNACTSGIAKVQDPVLLLQIMAQLTADLLTVVSPTTSTLIADILTRANTSGICKIQDEIMLLQIIAQNTCELDP